MSMKFWRGSGCVLYVATIANPASPTASEMSSGVDLSAGINAVRGFTSQVNRIGVPLLLSDTDVQVNGPASFVDSGFDLIEDDGTGSDVNDVARRTAITTLAKDTAGYFVFSRFKKKAALTSSSKVDVFTGFVGAANRDWAMDANVAKVAIDIILTAAPQQNVSVT